MVASSRPTGAEILNRVARGAASNYVARVISLVAWFFLTPFVLHRVGVSDYGLWVLVGSVIGYGALLDLGIGNAVVKYVAEHVGRGDLQRASLVASTSLTLFTMIGLAVVLISLGISPVFATLFALGPESDARVRMLVVLMGLSLGIDMIGSTSTAVLRGLQRFDLASLVGTVGTLLSVAAIAITVHLGGGVIGMVAVTIPVSILTLVLNLAALRRVAPALAFGFAPLRRPLLRSVLGFGWPLVLARLAAYLQVKSDEIVVAAFLPIAAVTPYALARRLSELALRLTEQFLKVLPPVASELDARDQPWRLKRLYVDSSRLTLAMALPIAGPIVALSPTILTLWVGAEYAAYGYLVTILTVASVVDASQWPAGLVLQGVGRHRPVALLSVGSGLANLALSVTLVQYVGLVGVAAGTLIPTVVECLFLVFPLALRSLRVSIAEAARHIVLPALVPLAPMALVLLLIQLTVRIDSWFLLIACAGSASGVYALTYIFVSASRGERQFCRSVAASALTFVQGRRRHG